MTTTVIDRRQTSSGLRSERSHDRHSDPSTRSRPVILQRARTLDGSRRTMIENVHASRSPPSPASARPEARQSMWTVLWTTGRSDDTRCRAPRSTSTRLTALLQLSTVLTLERGLQAEFISMFVWDSEGTRILFCKWIGLSNTRINGWTHSD